MKTKLQLKHFNWYSTDERTTYIKKSDDIEVKILGPGLKYDSLYHVVITITKNNIYPVKLLNSPHIDNIKIGLGENIIMYSEALNTMKQALNFANKVLF